MAEVFTEQWWQNWAGLINSDESLQGRAPEGVWRVYVVIEGDRKSPYLQEGESRQIMLHLENGRCVLLEQVDSPPGARELDFRFTGPASVFEGIAAGVVDPVDAGLEGQIAIAGDMRFLLRYAELVSEIMELYSKKLETDWPKGKPPYDGE